VKYLHNRGFRPKIHWLDNEASEELKQFNKSKQIEFQLVPPHMHRRNAAEREIGTWKNHFVAGLCSTDTRFPMHLWDRLLEQASITLNLLRPSRRNPKISAYNMLEGTFDYNKTPLAPPGTKVIIHEEPQQRKTWDPHQTEGWYLGPAMEHYQCHQVFTNKTKAERIMDMVKKIPQHTTIPSMTTDEIAIQAASDLIAAINQPTANTTIAPIGDKHISNTLSNRVKHVRGCRPNTLHHFRGWLHHQARQQPPIATQAQTT
jgi:hypothetical protein